MFLKGTPPRGLLHRTMAFLRWQRAEIAELQDGRKGLHLCEPPAAIKKGCITPSNAVLTRNVVPASCIVGIYDNNLRDPIGNP